MARRGTVLLLGGPDTGKSTLARELVVVDTSGLVEGAVARTLKQAKADLLRPDLVLAIEAGRELEGILKLIESGSEAEVLRLARPADARPKPPPLRRARRALRFFR